MEATGCRQVLKAFEYGVIAGVITIGHYFSEELNCCRVFLFYNSSKDTRYTYPVRRQMCGSESIPHKGQLKWNLVGRRGKGRRTSVMKQNGTG